ncbi:hypothetical protein N7522_003573, partial [Penicillium canescens]
GKRARPYDTVEPLAEDLGLTVDTSCDWDDPRRGCEIQWIRQYPYMLGARRLTDIVEKLGDRDAPPYPDDSYNIIWTDPSPYSDITAKTSEDCPGLDN